jgi:hypothetical protein
MEDRGEEVEDSKKHEEEEVAKKGAGAEEEQGGEEEMELEEKEVIVASKLRLYAEGSLESQRQKAAKLLSWSEAEFDVCLCALEVYLVSTGTKVNAHQPLFLST